jgi:hypothetical protein
LPPLPAKDHGIKLRAGEEGQENGAGARQVLDPGRVAVEERRAQRRADRQLRDRADDDFGQRAGDAKPDRQHRGEQREAKPQRR